MGGQPYNMAVLVVYVEDDLLAASLFFKFDSWKTFSNLLKKHKYNGVRLKQHQFIIFLK